MIKFIYFYCGFVYIEVKYLAAATVSWERRRIKPRTFQTSSTYAKFTHDVNPTVSHFCKIFGLCYADSGMGIQQVK